jgi:hypothetical protein
MEPIWQRLSSSLSQIVQDCTEEVFQTYSASTGPQDSPQHTSLEDRTGIRAEHPLVTFGHSFTPRTDEGIDATLAPSTLPNTFACSGPGTLSLGDPSMYARLQNSELAHDFDPSGWNNHPPVGFITCPGIEANVSANTATDRTETISSSRT